MREAQHLAESIEGFLVNPQSGWFTVFIEAVKGLTPQQAARIPAERFNSVWSVVNHMGYWQEFLLLRLQGQEVNRAALGGEDGWPPVADPDDKYSWQEAVDKVVQINHALCSYIAQFTDEQLDEPYAPERAKRWQVLQGILAHNSYHTCEIITIRHMQGLWLERT